jgi:hypothetical protein
MAKQSDENSSGGQKCKLISEMFLGFVYMRGLIKTCRKKVLSATERGGEFGQKGLLLWQKYN